MSRKRVSLITAVLAVIATMALASPASASPATDNTAASGAPVAAQASIHGVTQAAMPHEPIPAGQAVQVTEGDVHAAAWSDCPAGSFCIWSGSYASGSRCTWSSADPDWFSGAIQCSWADTQPVRSMYNHGTSTSYWGVGIYAKANYTGSVTCLRQGYAFSDISYFYRSHKWQTSCG
ncbi:peptidase inhibitor family I36 protein [Micromonospora carbonacea]|uniref:peptidase inhibitor family I36 protein n=1 Tax=Micromonospora carbonacea TaxID=47853 RepID=UPI003D761C1F